MATVEHILDYATLGTSNNRSETREDHAALRNLMARRWASIRRFPYESPERIKDVQFKRLQQLVRHAFDTVQIYREKYAAAGFTPDNLRSWDDFERLPIMTKGEMIAGFPSHTISSAHSLEFTTRSSGSSGRFITIAISPEAIYIDTIQGARQFDVQSGGRFGPEDEALFIYTSPWWVASIDGKYRTHFLPTTSSAAEAEQAIGQVRPKVLSVYPTYLKLLRGRSTDLKDAGIELIVTHSEQSTRREREELSDFFGVPVLDEFSSEELTRIALECSHHRYHLEEDACYVEIVDPDSTQPLPKGRRGIVIGTNLLNEATPIIRYFQGDVAILEGETSCACGSHFRTLSAPEGRLMDSIHAGNGLFVPASCFMDLAYNWYLEANIPVHGMKYQIVQQQSRDIDVFLAPECYPLNVTQQELIRESLYQLVPRTLAVNVHIVAEVPNNGGTKYRPVISNAER